MGATNFGVMVEMPKSGGIKKAFKKAKEEAFYIHGHGGYTGSIAEKETFTLITSRIVNEDEVRDLAREAMHADDDPFDFNSIGSKYGPAGALKVRQDGIGETLVYFFGIAAE